MINSGFPGCDTVFTLPRAPNQAVFDVRKTR
jgi:hypothetical protein